MFQKTTYGQFAKDLARETRIPLKKAKELVQAKDDSQKAIKPPQTPVNDLEVS